ncbi:Type 1 glutamine amidotransferase-like domain-containing protein [Gordonia rubripertincta]|uniref:Type 1 glutamine amidotransferase-like domain-containing protein n=1 Tax=Gordonia rubripertincta TaxID=36822 RepID=A0ABT4MQT8_GORRU|nr:Type 1 glutamine amidotransferase-like domain-containing protein [Gordonia rubripertincta]MCZ4549204.1 Type 1 glutamine amidotransferase-like domain-containing protein [Gordonia rubripertincta]
MAELLLVSRWLSAVPGFLTPKVGPGARIGFVPTASSIYDDRAWVDLDRTTLHDQGWQTVELDIEAMTAANMEKALATVDAVFVSGGNVFHLLAAMRRTGFADKLTAHVQAGLPYIGASAGACVIGADIEPLGLLDDPTEATGLHSTTGLGWIDEVIVPHADGIVSGPAVVDEVVRLYGKRFALRLITDDQAVLVSGSAVSIVSS